MILTLALTGPGAERVASTRKVFDAAGGSIGRLSDNDWVLADPYISSRHALIRYANGGFSIEDMSRNGVFINSLDNRLMPGQPHRLVSGDRIFIDRFQIEALITKEDDAVVLPAFPKASVPPPTEALPHDDVDPLSLLGLDSVHGRTHRAPCAAALAARSVLEEPYQAPALLIPDDYDPFVADAHSVESDDSTSRRQPGPASETPVRKASPERLPDTRALGPSSVAGTEALSALLEAAGLDHAALTPDLARGVGRILRVVVSGIMDVLQARQQTKEEFRIGMTRFKRADNNPLKFSANVEDALHNLFVRRNAAYLGPVDAFEDAFEDLRHHQIATLAGLRTAFDAMLAEFDPDRLQEEFDREVKDASLLPLPARLRYWRRYRDRFDAMRRDADTSFRELFGDEFGRAYEEQLKRLKGGACQQR